MFFRKQTAEDGDVGGARGMEGRKKQDNGADLCPFTPENLRVHLHSQISESEAIWLDVDKIIFSASRRSLLENRNERNP